MVSCRWARRLLMWGMFLSLTATNAGAQLPWGDVYEHSTGTLGTRLWTPDNTPTIKGILIYGNGAGADFREFVYAPWLQQFAVLHDFAIIGTSMWGNLSGREINTWDAHLAALATLSGHPELVHAPWAPMGFSNGGSMAYGFNALRPEKTIAFVANKGCCYNNRTPPVAALKTPGILVSGELDTAFRHDSIKGLFDTNRPRGALWSWTEQEGMAHEGFVDELILPFLAEAIRLRYPVGQAPTATNGVALRALNESEGWLVNQTTWKSGLTKVAAYEEYVGDKQQAGWVLNENIAAVYRAFSTYDTPAHLEFGLDFEWPWGVFVSFQTPSTLALKLDLNGLPDWSRIELLNYATPVLTLTPGGTSGNVLTLQAPIPKRGVYGFSALVTHADGVTQSTSNVLAFTATPEPSGAVLVAFAALVLPCHRRARSRVTPC